ncbi:glycosyltransferase [Subtercola boreus]|uniref:glycosyltransferase n=1 Tax=Subtercola boreus TaxID=120213 RepID=UPI000E2EEF9D|nr:glycosyltransferase [Subtercola boreus]
MTARRPLVGWYVHSHGAGHRTRFDAVRRELDADVVVFSTLPPPMVLADRTRWVMLDHDNQVERTESGDRLDPALADPTAGGVLHWAPLNHSGHASRLGVIAASLASERFDCFVVDVSVEVTLLARLFGVPTVVLTQPGERDDAPHALAFSAATRIIAPWPEALYVPRALESFRSTVSFVGGISRFDGRARIAGGSRPAVVPGSVLVLGAGGPGAVSSEVVERAAVATIAASPGTTWSALGLPPTAHVSSTGWQDDPFDQLVQAEVVVSFAGQNAIADLAASGARAIVVPAARPFDEQAATADTLERTGLAIVAERWPEPSEWPGMLARARASTPAWSAWQVAGAASRTAEAIAVVAARSAGTTSGTASGAAPGAAPLRAAG